MGATSCFSWAFGGIRIRDTAASALLPRTRGKSNPIPGSEFPFLIRAISFDASRSFANSTQDITLYFSEAMADAALSLGGTATGYTIYINGTPFTPTYRSGSGTSVWVLRVASLVRRQDDVGVTYDRTTGATIATADSVELRTETRAFTDPFDLTKRVRFTLCDSADALVANEAVKAAVLEYGGGDAANVNFMVRANGTTVTTDAAGLFDMQYTGTSVGGSTVYVVVFRAAENMATSTALT